MTYTANSSFERAQATLIVLTRLTIVWVNWNEDDWLRPIELENAITRFWNMAKAFVVANFLSKITCDLSGEWGEVGTIAETRKLMKSTSLRGQTSAEGFILWLQLLLLLDELCD